MTCPGHDQEETATIELNSGSHGNRRKSILHRKSPHCSDRTTGRILLNCFYNNREITRSLQGVNRGITGINPS